MAIRMDDFVAKIVTDPKNPPNTLLLKGFIGASSEKGYIRLYFDSELSDYIEIPETAVLHSLNVPPEKSPVGGSYVWIQRDASLIHGPVVTERPKASFLEGRIMTTQACAVGTALATTLTGPQCGTIIDGCTDVGPKCPTQVTCPAPCVTKTGITCPAPCATKTGATCPAPCGTQSGPNCPTAQGNSTCPAPSCTQTGPTCPTSAQFTCSGPNCPTIPDTTCCGPNCPTFPPNTICGPTCHTVSGTTCPAPSCTQTGPGCPTASGNATCPTPVCTQSGPSCPTKVGHATCPAPTCTESGPVCQTKLGPNCVFPTEVGNTCVGPCHQP